MRNFIQEGCVLTLAAPYNVLSGAGFQVGSIFAVASNDALSGATVEGATEGVFDLAKTSAQAWTIGQKVYWDNTNKRCDTDGTVGMLIGAATAVAANPTSTGHVKLNEAVPSGSEGPQAAIADLNLTTLTDAPATADALRDNLTATWETEIEAKVNAILTALRTGGVILP